MRLETATPRKTTREQEVPRPHRHGEAPHGETPHGDAPLPRRRPALAGRRTADVMASIRWDGGPGRHADRSPLWTARRFFATFPWEGGRRSPRVERDDLPPGLATDGAAARPAPATREVA